MSFDWHTGLYTHKCVVCGDNFSAKRSDAKTCGETCRKRYSRRTDEIMGWAKDASSSVRQMISHAHRYPDLDKNVRASLTDLVGMIQAELEK